GTWSTASPTSWRESPTPCCARPWSCATTSWERFCGGREGEGMASEGGNGGARGFGCPRPPGPPPPGGAGRGEGSATAEVVGNKGANLIRMAEAGLPVPPGFVLPTGLCRAYFQSGQRLPEGTPELLRQGIREVEKPAGLSFGGDRRPLLVAV